MNMRYHYVKPDLAIPVYGEDIQLNDHPIYKAGTLFEEHGKGFIVVQQHFKPGVNDRMCWWGSVDPDVANDIYLAPNFKQFFDGLATEGPNYPIFRLRKIMWVLRMKPLKKEEWEEFF